jgi:hypothetical protein
MLESVKLSFVFTSICGVGAPRKYGMYFLQLCGYSLLSLKRKYKMHLHFFEVNWNRNLKSTFYKCDTIFYVIYIRHDICNEYELEFYV